MIQKISGIILLFTSLILASIFLLEEHNANLNHCSSPTPAQQLKQIIEKDFILLAKSQKLPVQWAFINKVNIKMNSQLAQYIMGDSTLKFDVKQNGNHYLDLDILDIPDDKNPAILIQASLFDQKTKNKIFEIGRTYKTEDLNAITQ